MTSPVGRSAHDRAATVLLAEAALVVALSVALGNLRLLELPGGGSISFGALPVLAFAATHGVSWGVRTGLCAGLAHALAGGTIIHPAQFALDYGLAYGALGLAGIACGRGAWSLRAGIVAAQAAQFACFVYSGLRFFAPPGAETGPALVYAAGYNAITVLPETAFALWLVPVLVAAYAVATGRDDRLPSARPARPLARRGRLAAASPISATACRPAPRSQRRAATTALRGGGASRLPQALPAHRPTFQQGAIFTRPAPFAPLPASAPQ